jgi:hypothetical protein
MCNIYEIEQIPLKFRLALFPASGRRAWTETSSVTLGSDDVSVA